MRVYVPEKNLELKQGKEILVMNNILNARRKIVDYIESNPAWIDACSDKKFEKYCVAKDTIQDTAEALQSHNSFSNDTGKRYLEYYGILQSVYLQQDAIMVLFNLFAPKKFDDKYPLNWEKLRDLRNNTVGHPVGRKTEPTRLNRNIISYSCVNYQRHPNRNYSSWKDKNINLGKLITGYEKEASKILNSVYEFLSLNSNQDNVLLNSSLSICNHKVVKKEKS